MSQIEKKKPSLRRPTLKCVGCHKPPEQLAEYVAEAEVAMCTPYEYVWSEEGTLNKRTGFFLCTSCYIEAGMPTLVGGWTVPYGWRMPGRMPKL